MREFAPVLAILFITLPGCHPQPKPAGCPELLVLQNRDPRADAISAFGKGDQRFLEMGGYQPTVPGAEDRNGLIKVPPGASFRMMEGTRDGDSPACDALIGDARAYAKSYNQEILALKAKRGGG